MKYLICFFVFCLASISYSLEGEHSDVDILSTYLERLNNIQADFVQHTHDGAGTLLQTQKGYLSLTKPNKFKWVSEPPYEQSLVSNGVTLWQFDPDLEQVTVQKLDDRLSSTPVLLLSGDSVSISKEYQVFSETLQDERHFVLIPNRADTLFDRLRLEFDSQQNLSRMEIKDEAGQKTVIYFKDIKVLQSIKPSEYEFDIPEGIDVIKSQ